MLIFDSGIGGLSILENIKNNFPNINYIYLLDNEGFPYGEKKESFIIQRSINIINTIQKIYPINIVIIACNTASTISLSILKKNFDIPIIGVLPSLTKAIKITQNNIIGLIATKATIKSTYTQNILSKYIYIKKIKVIATNKLAEIAEKKIKKLPISNLEVKKIFHSWILSIPQPDTIYLGCTHFTFLKHEIQNIFKKPIHFVETHETVTKMVKKFFLNNQYSQKIKKKIFLYSKNNIELNQLFWILKKYQFRYIKRINLD